MRGSILKAHRPDGGVWRGDEVEPFGRFEMDR